jgi:hypothetical protein
MHTYVKTWLGLTVIVIMALTAGMFIYFCGKKFAVDENGQVYKPIGGQLACTEEAKLCPDGSYVSRTGPKCRFTACPEVVITGIPGKLEISSPKNNEIISSPMAFDGKAVGTWFFEGSFPVEIYDSNNKLLGSSSAAFLPLDENDTWMTEEFVNFQGEMEFNKPKTETGYILFKKDNPSDMRELDESFKLPIKFIN